MSVVVSTWVWQHSEVEQRGDLLVLLALADHAQDDGTKAYPSVATLAQKARLSRRGVQLALRRLETQGAIVQAGSGPRGCVSYSIPMGAATSPSLGAVTSPGELTSRANSVPQGGEVSDTKGANRTSPEPSIEPSKNRPSGDRESKKSVKHNGKVVPAGRLSLAVAVLGEFNRQTGSSIGPYTGAGKPSDSLTRIIGALVSWPDRLDDFDSCAHLITVALKSQWWGPGPASVGVVFGPRVIEQNFARAEKAPGGASRGGESLRDRLVRESNEREAKRAARRAELEQQADEVDRRRKESA